MRILCLTAVFAANLALAIPCKQFQAAVNRGTVSDGRLDEVSGIVASRQNQNVHWVHNDSGDEARIFAVNHSGAMLGEFDLGGALNQDYEDIGIWRDTADNTWYLYVADIGDNNLVRSSIRVVKVPEPAVSASQSPPLNQTINGNTSHTLQYPDGAHNAETFFVDPASGDWYIITKSSPAVPRVYRAAYPQPAAGTITLQYLGDMVQTTELVGGDISQAGDEILVKDNDTIWHYCVTGGQSIASALAGTPRTVPYVFEPKGEAITWRPDAGSYFTTSENGNQPLYEFLAQMDVIGFPCEFGPLTATEGQTLSFIVPFTNTAGVTFSLTSFPPGASIDSSTGAFSWTPDETTGGSTVSVTVSGSVGGQSSTLSFDIVVTENNHPPQLSPTVAGVCTTNAETWVTTGDSWKYRDDGSDQGTAWRAAGFDDSAWAAGQSELGYGDGDEATQVDGGPNNDRHITTYFRHSVTVDTSGVVDATLSVIRDDGVAVYFNGALVLSDNLPASYDYETQATDGVGNAQESIPVVQPVPLASLADNLTIAAEIHQQNPNSSDISFDLRLDILRETCTPGGLNACVGHPFTTTFTATDPDTPPQDLAFSLVSGALPGMVLSPNGSFTWNVPADQPAGIVGILVQVSDGIAVDRRVYEIVVERKPPVIDPLGPFTVDEETPLTFTPNLSQGDATFVAAGAPAGSTIDPATGRFDWTPTEAQGPGVHTFDLVAIDVLDAALVTTQSISVTVNEVNEPPVLAPIDDTAAAPGGTVTIPILALDPDLPAQSIAYAIDAGSQSGMGIDPNTGLLTWNVPGGQTPGDYTITISATDGTLTDTGTFTITVSLTPFTLTPIAPIQVAEGGTAGFTATMTDSTLVGVAYSVSGAPTGATIGASDGVFAWTTDEADGPDTYTFDLIATLGALADTQAITIVVDETNTPPSLADPFDTTQLPGSTFSFSASATDPDLPEQTLTYHLVSAPQPGLTISPAGAFNWDIPGTYPSGPVNITIGVSDGEVTTTQTFLVNMGASAPDLQPLGPLTTPEESLLTFTPTLATPTPPGVVFTLQSAPAGATIDANSGEVSWTPGESDGAGTALVVIKATDLVGRGDTLPVTIDVQEVNQPPTIAPIGDSAHHTGETVTRAVVATDSDLPAQSITLSLIGAEPGMSLAADGSFAWTIPANQPAGDVTVTVQAHDGTATGTEVFVITVRPDPPEIQPLGPYTIAEGSPLEFTATVTDPSLSGLTWSATNLPPGATFNPFAAFAWTPAEAQGPGSYTVDITVVDGYGQSDTRAVAINVTEINTPPVLGVIAGGSYFLGDTVNRSASATDADLPAQTLTYSIASGVQPGMSIAAGTGAFAWNIPADQAPGDYTVTILVSDGSATDQQSFVVHIDQAAPVLAAVGPHSIDEEQPFDFTATTTDAGLTGLTWSAVGIPVGSTFSASTGAFAWTPTEAQGPGSYSFDIVVTGPFGRADTGTVSITVLEANRPPVLAPLADTTATPGATVTRDAGATDPDLPAQSISYSIVAGAQTGMSIDPVTGSFTWNVPANQAPGDYSVGLAASDGTGGFDTESFVIHIQQAPPVLNALGPFTTAEMALFNFTATTTDHSLTGLVWSAVGHPAGSGIDAGTGVFTWTPTEADGPGGYMFDVIVHDALGRSDTQSVSVTVTEANRPPVLTAPTDVAGTAGEIATVSPTATDPDLPAQSLSWSISAGWRPGMIIDNTTGVLTWNVPSDEAAGDYTVTLRVSDGSLADTADTTFHIGQAAPVIAAAGPFTIPELVAFSNRFDTTDPTLPGLTWSLANAPAGAAIAPATGVLTWTPTEAQGPGNHSIDVIVTDSQNRSDTSAVSIAVTEVNQPPAADAIVDRAAFPGDTVSFTASATDPDFPAQTLTWSILSGGRPGMSIGAAGNFVWDVPANEPAGDVPVTLAVSDGALSDTETFVIHIGQAAPVIAPIAAITADELSPVTFTATTTDNSLTGLVWSAGGLPAGAMLAANGAFAWTPDESQGPGAFGFDIVVTDALGRADTQAVAITVNEVNAPPALAPIATVNAFPGDTVTRDADATDPDLPAQTLTYSIGAGQLAGMSIVAGTGEFTWNIPAGQAAGTYTVTIQVSDGTAVDSRDFDIRVGQSGPILEPRGPFSIDEESPFSFTAAVTDPGLTGLTYSVTGAPAGSTFDPATGVFTWTPAEDQGPGSAELSVTVTDSLSRSDNQTVSITVDEVNLPPTLAPIADGSVTAGDTFSTTASGADPDLPAQTLGYTIHAGQLPGMSINPFGGFSWDVSANQAAGVHTVTIAVSDGLATATRSFDITVGSPAPTIAPLGPFTIDEETTLDFNATVNESGLTGLAWSLSGAPTGAAIDPATGLFSWTPTESQGPGQFVFEVMVTDSQNRGDTHSVTTTVAEVNSPPVLDPLAGATAQPGDTVTRVASATDTDLPAQAITYTIASGALPGMFLDDSSGAFSWNIPAGQAAGTYTVAIEASDGVDTMQQPLQITVGAPETVVLQMPGPFTIDEQTELAFTAQATPTGATFSLSGAPPAASVDPVSGAFTWTPSEAEGPASYSFDLIATLGNSFDRETVTVSVNEANRPPELAPFTPATALPGDTVNRVASATDPDLPQQGIHYTIEAGQLTGMSIEPFTGAFAWNIPANQAPGVYDIAIRASDSTDADTEILRVQIGQTPVTLQPIGPFAVDEESTLTFSAVATPVDAAYSLSGAPSGATIDPATGAFTWTPTEAQGPGTFSFDVVASDHGAAATQTVEVAVSEINRPPELASISAASAMPGDTVVRTAVANDPDLPAQSLTYRIATGSESGMFIDATTGGFAWTIPPAQSPGNYAVSIEASDGVLTDTVILFVSVGDNRPSLSPIGPFTINEHSSLEFTADATPAGLTYSLSGEPSGATIDPTTGAFTWTPTEAQGAGSYSFDVLATDSLARNDRHTVLVTVNEVNQAPTATGPATGAGDPGTTQQAQFAATDPDLPAQILTWSILGTPLPGLGLNAATGLLTWNIPGDQAAGDYPIILQVSDGDANDSITHTVTVGTAAPTLQPVAPTSVVEETTIHIALTANRPDLTYALGGAPTNATIDGDGVITWTPTEAQGPATVTFTASATDARNRSATTTIRVTVLEANRPPQLDAIDAITGNPGDTATTTATGSDPDLPAQSLTFSLGGGAHPGMTIDADTGAFAWAIPATQAAGTYPVDILLSDGTASDTAPLLVTVGTPAVRLNPIAPITIDEGATASFTASVAESRPGLSYSLSGAPAGAGIDPTTGAFTWPTTEADGPSIQSFTVIARTDDGDQDARVAEITVREINRAPEFPTFANQSVAAGDTLNLNLAATDPDLPAQPLRYAILAGTQPGMTLDASTGALVWNVPASHAASTYPLLLQVFDGALNDTLGLLISVQPGAPVLDPIDNMTVDEETPVRFTATVSNVSGPFEFHLVDAPASASIDPTTGVFTWTPSESEAPGNHLFEVIVANASDPGQADTQTVIITVHEVNRPPVFRPVVPVAGQPGTTLGTDAVADDPDLPTQPLTYRIVSGAQPGMQINSVSGTVTWTVPGTQSTGAYAVQVSVSDGLASAETTVTFDISAPSLSLASIDPLAVDVGQRFEFQPTVNEPGLDALYFIADAPPAMSIDPFTGVISWTPATTDAETQWSILVTVIDRANPGRRATTRLPLRVHAAVPALDIAYESLLPVVPSDLVWSTAPGRTYLVERCTDILNPTWEIVATIVAESDIGAWEDAAATNPGNIYFYRARLLP